jgi:hypothetical protein
MGGSFAFADGEGDVGPHRERLPKRRAKNKSDASTVLLTPRPAVIDYVRKQRLAIYVGTRRRRLGVDPPAERSNECDDGGDEAARSCGSTFFHRLSAGRPPRGQ